MRSCAAMLSVQREFRRHCPAEAEYRELRKQLSMLLTAGGYAANPRSERLTACNPNKFTRSRCV